MSIPITVNAVASTHLPSATSAHTHAHATTSSIIHPTTAALNTSTEHHRPAPTVSSAAALASTNAAGGLVNLNSTASTPGVSAGVPTTTSSHAAPSGSSSFRGKEQRPVYLLSVALLGTYKRINEKYYEGERVRQAKSKGKGVHNDGYDDDEGNYIVRKGEEIYERYIVQEILGKGSFGVVVKAHDHCRDEAVALKIIRNRHQFHTQARVEIDILAKLSQTSTEEKNIVKLRKVFPWKGHVCLTFELLSLNLFELIKCTKFTGVSLNLIRKFGMQILKTLEFLGSPEIRIIHSDLKPENILLKNPKRSGIKVIDFGSSCYASKPLFRSYIQSRFYRCPEVILGLAYDCAIDMWSLGCILVELHTGAPLFDGKNEREQLVKFQRLLGPIPQRLVAESPKVQKFYRRHPESNEYVLLKATPTPENPNPDFETTMGPVTTLEQILEKCQRARQSQPGHSEADYALFVDMLTKILKYDPKERVLPTDALGHPFLRLPDEVQQQSTVSPTQGQGASASVAATHAAASSTSSGDLSTQLPPASAAANSSNSSHAIPSLPPSAA